MQPRLEVPNLYTGEDTLHFNRQVHNQAYDSRITKNREETLAKLGPSNIVLIVCAGWNAEGNQTSSMKEAFCASSCLCATTQEILSNGRTWIPNVVGVMNTIGELCQRCYSKLIDTITKNYSIWTLQHGVNQTKTCFKWWHVRTVYLAHANTVSVGALQTVYDCNTSYCFFSMCAVIFCGRNLFGHQVFLHAIAVMSSQQIRILQSSNLYWCRNSHNTSTQTY